MELRDYLLTHPSIFQSHADLRAEVRQRIRQVLGSGGEGSLLDDNGPTAELDRQLARPEMRLFEEIFRRNRFVRHPDTVQLLFGLFSHPGGSPATYAELEPLLRAFRRASKLPSTPLDAEYAKTNATPRAIGVLLFGVLDHVFKTRRRARPVAVDRLAEFLTSILSNTSGVMLHILRESRRLAGDADALTRWLEALVTFQDAALWRAGGNYVGLDLSLGNFARRTAPLARRSPDALAAVARVASGILERDGSFQALCFLDHVGHAARSGVLPAYCDVARLLLDHSPYTAMHWFQCFRRYLRMGFTCDEIRDRWERWLATRSTESGAAIYKHMLRPLGTGSGASLRPHVRDASLIRSWWDFAEELGRRHDAAASFFLRDVSQIYLKFGARFTARWMAAGGGLVEEFRQPVGAYFFARSNLLARLTKPVSPAWFARLLVLCRRDVANVAWMPHDLHMRSFRKRGVSFRVRYNRAVDALGGRYGRPPLFTRYAWLDLTTARRVDGHLRLWELVAEYGCRTFLNAPVRAKYAVRLDPHALGSKGEATRRFWDLFWQQCRGSRGSAANPAAADHPLLGPLCSPEVLREIDALMAMPIRRKVISVDAAQDAGRGLSIGELLYLIEKVPAGEVPANWLAQQVRRCVERSSAAVRLRKIVRELDYLPTALPPFSEVLIESASVDSLLGILSGEEWTTSCTDGPGGEHRHAGVIHALHAEAAKVLVSYPSANHGFDRPVPFVSVPCFRVRCAGGRDALLVDTIDAGWSVHAIRGGVAAIAQALVDYFVHLASAARLPVFLAAHFLNVRGMEIVREAARVQRLQPASLECSVPTEDLVRLGVRRFYWESQNLEAPWVRTARRPRTSNVVAWGPVS